MVKPNNFNLKVIMHETKCLHKKKSFDSPCKCGDVLKQVADFKYLGVIVDENLNWNKQIDTLCKRLGYCAWSLWNLRLYVPESVMLIVYRSLVESVLDYGLTAWGLASNYKIAKIQKLQDKCVKTLAGKNLESFSLDQIYEKFGLLKVTSMVKFKLIKRYHFNTLYREEKSHPHQTRLNRTPQYKIPVWCNKYGKRTLEYVIPSLYNSLPLNLRSATGIQHLKTCLKKWLIEAQM